MDIAVSDVNWMKLMIFFFFYTKQSNNIALVHIMACLGVKNEHKLLIKIFVGYVGGSTVSLSLVMAASKTVMSSSFPPWNSQERMCEPCSAKGDM